MSLAPRARGHQAKELKTRKSLQRRKEEKEIGRKRKKARRGKGRQGKREGFHIIYIAQCKTNKLM